MTFWKEYSFWQLLILFCGAIAGTGGIITAGIMLWKIARGQSPLGEVRKQDSLKPPEPEMKTIVVGTPYAFVDAGHEVMQEIQREAEAKKK